MSRSEQIRADAKRTEETLRQSGLIRLADTIRRLLASHSTATATLKVLHRDNMGLRKQLGLPSYLDAMESGKSPANLSEVDPQTPPPPGK